MAYTTTPLGQKLADPATIQPFETTQVNTNLLLLEAAITDDSGWVDITVLPGFLAQNPGTEQPQVRRLGKRVITRGGWNISGIPASATTIIGQMPTGFSPPYAVVGAAGTASAISMCIMRIDVNGQVSVRTAASTSSYYFLNGAHSWTKD